MLGRPIAAALLLCLGSLASAAERPNVLTRESAAEWETWARRVGAEPFHLAGQ